jgi:purine-nucleoside phosphorylase
LNTKPDIGVILGTGLSQLEAGIQIDEAIPYSSIPNFPVSTVTSHTGRLLIGRIGEVPVLALQGRFHLYEGYTSRQVTFPIRVLAGLGIQTLYISNAAGGLNTDFRAGELMMLTDHVNLQGDNPLEGPNEDTWGPRFPDMSMPYDPSLASSLRSIAQSEGIRLHEGVYVAVTGPNLETRAEYRMLSLLGADAVGMSTVPEVIVARHMGIRIAAISVITDECDPDNLHPVSLDNILAAADKAAPSLARLFDRCIAETHSS